MMSTQILPFPPPPASPPLDFRIKFFFIYLRHVRSLQSRGQRGVNKVISSRNEPGVFSQFETFEILFPFHFQFHDLLPIPPPSGVSMVSDKFQNRLGITPIAPPFPKIFHCCQTHPKTVRSFVIYFALFART